MRVIVAVLCVATLPPVMVMTAVALPVLTLATEGLLLVHVPATPSLSVVVRPAHMVVLPDMAVGSGFTVTVCCALQPVGVSE